MLPATVVYVYTGWAGGEALAGEGTMTETLVRVVLVLSALGALAVLPRLVVRLSRARTKGRSGVRRRGDGA